jgi:lysozyme
MTDIDAKTYRKKVRDMLIEDEGLRLRAYKCTAGYYTIGCGRNIQARGVTGVRLLYYKTVGITKEQAIAWLDEDVATAESDCRKLFGDALFDSWSENRRLGWVNFLFNVGINTALKFKWTLKHATAQDWRKVRMHLESSLWFRQVKTRGPKVVALICDERWPYGS